MLSVSQLVQSLSCVRLFATTWIAARQASLSITNSRSSLRLTSIKLVMLSSHLILCHPLLLLPPIPPNIRVFANESTFHIRWPKYWSFSFSIRPSKEHPGLISFRMDWLDPKLVLVVRKHLASLGIKSSEARWSFSSKSISEVKGYSDWDCNEFFPLVMLATSGPEEALILVWWWLEGTSQYYVSIGLIVVRNILRVMHRHSGDECFPQRS